MEELVQLMRKILSNSFVFYVKAQNYHWNIEGKDFPQYHEFFGNLYKEVYSSIDSTGEHIRALDEYAPGSLKRFNELTELSEEVIIPPFNKMLLNLYNDNNIILKSLISAYKMAEEQDRFGLSNFLANRIEQHRIHAWMLKASMKEV